MVTGANQGVGLEVASKLAANGVTVYLGSRNLARGESAAGIPTRATAIQINVTDLASIAAAADRIRAEHGRLDLLVNNAGISNTRTDNPTREEMAASSTASTGRGSPYSIALSSMRDSCRVFTVLMRHEYHVDHMFLEATHYPADEAVLTVHLDDQEVACFRRAPGTAYTSTRANRVREKDGGEGTAQRLEVQLSVAH